MLSFKNFIKKIYDIFIVDELNGFKPLSLVELLLLDFFFQLQHTFDWNYQEFDAYRDGQKTEKVILCSQTPRSKTEIEKNKKQKTSYIGTNHS